MGFSSDTMNAGLLSGGAEGFIKGWQDADDRNMRKIEMDAKLKSQAEDRERQHTMDQRVAEQSSQQLALRKRQQMLELKTHGYAIQPGQDPDQLDVGCLEQDPKWLDNQIKIAGAKASAADAAKPPSTDQFNAAGYVKRMEDAEGNLKQLTGEGFDPTTAGTQAQRMIPGFAEGMKSPEVKRYEQIVRNFGSAILRKQSGAAISASEYADTDKNYFPQPGDTPEVLAQKTQARQEAIAALRAEGGKAYKKIAPVAKPQGLVKSGKLGAQKGLVSAPDAPGKVKVSDGKETLMIDASDLEHAMKDGFKQVK